MRGTCEPTGYCSDADTTCPGTPRRYHDSAGQLAGRCVDGAPADLGSVPCPPGCEDLPCTSFSDLPRNDFFVEFLEASAGTSEVAPSPLRCGGEALYVALLPPTGTVLAYTAYDVMKNESTSTVSMRAYLYRPSATPVPGEAYFFEMLDSGFGDHFDVGEQPVGGEAMMVARDQARTFELGWPGADLAGAWICLSATVVPGPEPKAIVAYRNLSSGAGARSVVDLVAPLPASTITLFRAGLGYRTGLPTTSTELYLDDLTIGDAELPCP